MQTIIKDVDKAKKAEDAKLKKEFGKDFMKHRPYQNVIIYASCHGASIKGS